MRTFERENSEWPVPYGRTGAVLRSKQRSQIIAVIPVIGAKQNSRVLAGKLQQSAQKHVVKPITAINHIFVESEIVFRNVGHARRMIVHELMAEVVD